MILVWRYQTLIAEECGSMEEGDLVAPWQRILGRILEFLNMQEVVLCWAEMLWTLAEGEMLGWEEVNILEEQSLSDTEELC